MAHDSAGAVRQTFRTLWSAGAIGEADDCRLIERFVSGRRDEAAEAAFRVLVDRHGPMVLRVCRQVLGDDHDALDAAQAVFLVLAKKAGSIRSRGSVAPWLHGVARRVAAKARRREGARRSAESRTAEDAARLRGNTGGPSGVDDWGVIHEEVGRLPEKYRAPVVLCYLEGQTYDEAARRIGCPVGTVRVRLSRARDKLRDRLTRRGFAPSGLAAFLGPGEFWNGLPALTLPAGWVESTAGSSIAFMSGRAALAGTVPASVLALSEGVLRTMMLTQWKMATLGLVTAGVLVSSVGVIVGQEPQVPVSRDGEVKGPESFLIDEAKTKTKKLDADPVKESQKAEIKALGLRVLEAARRRLEAQRTFFDEGRITIDRYLDACDCLMTAEINVATNPAARLDAFMANLKRHEGIEDREKKELAAGRGTDADVSEATVRVDRLKFDMLKAQFNGGLNDSTDLSGRVDALEKKLDRVLKLLENSGVMPNDRRR